jgi:hypothetical protein
MHILLLLQNLVKLIDANTVKSHNGYWSEDKSSDVPLATTTIHVNRFVHNNQHTFVTKMY